MAKYDKYNVSSRARARPWKIHPVWRGIGCVMLILIPVMSYAGAILLVEANIEQRWLPMSREFSRTVALPLLGEIPHLFANLLTAALLSLLGFGILMVLYSLLYSMVGPPRYGPLDSPPVRWKARKRR
ncbi:MAG: hypothetical protein L0Z70_06725 [Chloroflexi bacterium]|nr:hypothetical protein [Chloroflexota bacterium]